MTTNFTHCYGCLVAVGVVVFWDCSAVLGQESAAGGIDKSWTWQA